MHKFGNSLKKRVFVLMSGGVDSSVAAALLKKQDYDVIGVFIKGWSPNGDCFVSDQEDARQVAEILGIPFYAFDFEKEYKKRVADYMIDGYKSGLTPNPDAECNRQIKFGLAAKKAFELGADFVASGHYARLRQGFGGQARIKKRQATGNKRQNFLFEAKDKNKDQSYFLWAIKPEYLSRIIFPIGEYTKPQVRQMAQKFGLPNFAKKDSQGICFMGKVKVDDFLKKALKSKKGKILDLAGNIIGEHQGSQIFTLGQRHGLNIQNGQGPYFVVAKDLKKNVVYVAKENEIPEIRQIELTGLNLFDKPLKNVEVRIRYHQLKQKARVVSFEKNRLVLEFKKPVKFAAPGQSGVIYQGEKLIGGGVITENFRILNPSFINGFTRTKKEIFRVFSQKRA